MGTGNIENVKENQETLTQEQVAQAFTNWENDLRCNPKMFLTREDENKLKVATLSESRAIWLFTYARQGY